MNSFMKLCSSAITIMIDTRAMISPHVKANKATHQSSSHKKMNITVFQNVCGHFLQISIKVQGIIEVIELPHFSLPARCQNGGPSCLE